MKRKICFVTGTRAEFGLLRILMQEVLETETLELQVIATGMHLSPEFGMTYQEIEEFGFKIDAKVEMLVSADTRSGVTKSVGLGLIALADAFSNLSPNIIVLLGDRFEIFAAAAAATFAGIPIAHLHGGETTEGAFDEVLRHSITKMSHLHFVAAEDYQKRVIQLGENPERVFLVGGLGVDAIKQISLLDQETLEKSLGFKFGKKNLLVTFHPVTLEDNSAKRQMKELLTSLNKLKDTCLIFTMPNADAGGREIEKLIKKFVETHSNSRLYKSLGQLIYLSCMKYVDGVVGNSSSGLLEAPSFGIGTINIGSRQKGRLSSKSVIDCEPASKSISQALERLYEPSFKRLLSETLNPYGDGGASKKIVETLITTPFEDLIKKSFFNLPEMSNFE